MKKIHASEAIKVPEGVDVKVRSRVVEVTGPRGTLKRSFKHTQCDIRRVNNTMVVEIWFGTSKQLSCIRTVCAHVKNMITGVTKGFEYKMRMVYAHFPVNCAIADDKKSVEIRNFLGEKIVRRVNLLEGVTMTRSDDVKDEIVLVGNDVENVGQSAALIYQSCFVKNKDIRKFLDGIYVSERNILGED